MQSKCSWSVTTISEPVTPNVSLVNQKGTHQWTIMEVLTSNADCLKESPQIWDIFGPNKLFSMQWPPKDKLRSFPSCPKICFSKLFRYLFFVVAAHPLSVITITNGSQSRISYLDIAHPVVFSAQNSSCLTFYENLNWKLKLQFRYSFYLHTVAESN